MFAIAFVIGCKESKPINQAVVVPKEIYPKVVHNVCIDKWAVRLGTERNMWNEKKIDTIYFGKTSFLLLERSSNNDTGVAYLGNEFQYPDSISALVSYRQWETAMNILEKHVADSVKNIRRIKDSIQKCNHTYN